MNKKTWKKLVLIVAVVLLLSATGVSAGEEYAKVINADNPGMTIDITGYVEKGKITIFDFYSKYCGPCMRLAPYLEELDKKCDDIVVCKVDMNRKNVRGIDWQSPLAKQYKLRSVPHFIIYGKDGKIMASGRSAYKKVIGYMKESGM